MSCSSTEESSTTDSDASSTNLKHETGALAIGLTLMREYYDRYVNKAPNMKESYAGDKWIGEMLNGSYNRFHNIFRMSQQTFVQLLEILTVSHGLHGSARTTSREVLGITLFILAQNESMRATSERFQRSGETISRYFNVGLKSLLNLAREIVAPTDHTFSNIPAEILGDSRYMPYFKDCIGAIDGTHVHASVPDSIKAAYIGRSGSPTQNVLACCDFNMCFTFIMAGWEGSAHDSRIFRFAMRYVEFKFPSPPIGKYYLVDAGFPMQRGFLKPFPETRYHIPDFIRSTQLPRTVKEKFNRRHSALRGTIERAFGVWKKKWLILKNMPSYSFKKQVDIVMATAALHNFIRRYSSITDIDFNEGISSTSLSAADEPPTSACSAVGEGVDDMLHTRDEIAYQIYNSWEG